MIRISPSPSRRTNAALLGLVVAAACSRTTPGAAQPAQTAARQSDLAAIAKARADSARRPYTAADVHFMSGMIGHHAQAIVMARWAPTHGASASVLTLAGRIINAQTDEIALMQQWLRDRQQAVPEPSPTGGAVKMMMNGMEHEMLMPGMLSDAQMKQLDAAIGSDFDGLFLRFMIQHHRGALDMVKDLFSSPGAGQDDLVFKFAADVNVDQTTEIARMERMLAAITLGINPPQ